MLRKKIATISTNIILLLGSTSLFAAPYNATLFSPYCYSSSIYVGANISGDSTKYKTELTDIRLSTGEITRFSRDTLNDIGPDAGFLLGYSFSFPNPLFIGIEGFVDVHSNKTLKTIFEENANVLGGTNFANFEVRHHRDEGISLIPGIKLNDKSSLYVRGGYVLGTFEYKGDGRALLPTGTLTSFDNKRELRGFQTGIGLETLFLKNLSIRGEWVINFYKSFSDPAINQAGNPEGNLTFTSPLVNEFKLGIDYRFNIV